MACATAHEQVLQEHALRDIRPGAVAGARVQRHRMQLALQHVVPVANALRPLAHRHALSAPCSRASPFELRGAAEV